MSFQEILGVVILLLAGYFVVSPIVRLYKGIPARLEHWLQFLGFVLFVLMMKALYEI